MIPRGQEYVEFLTPSTLATGFLWDDVHSAVDRPRSLCVLILDTARVRAVRCVPFR